MTPRTESNWIQTYTGRKFWPLDPRPEDVCIEDIAHALANKCRFTGHTRQFYSVAQHSVICSFIVRPENRLAALLHDASEAYLPDVSRPVKQHLDGFHAIEDHLMGVIGSVFGVSLPFPSEVKYADNVALVTERRDVMNYSGHWVHGAGYEPLTYKIVPVSPKIAKTLFLDRFKELSGRMM